MLRLLLMCLLGLLLEKSGVQCASDASASMMMESATAQKLKRHNINLSSPCPPFYPHFGHNTYLPPPHFSKPYGPPTYPKTSHVQSHQSTVKVAPYHFEKPIVPKIIYQTIPKPVIDHAVFHAQPIAKPIQYQQPAYVPIVQEHPMPHLYPIIEKPITTYVQPIQQHVQPIHHVQTIHQVQPVHQISVQNIEPVAKPVICKTVPGPTVIIDSKPVLSKILQPMHSYYPKQLSVPMSYYPKPQFVESKPISVSPAPTNHYPSSQLVYFERKNLASDYHRSIVKLQQTPKISYVKIAQPAHVNFIEPMVHAPQTIHQPTIQRAPIFHQYTQPIPHGNIGHPVDPWKYAEHYQSSIVKIDQPCHK